MGLHLVRHYARRLPFALLAVAGLVLVLGFVHQPSQPASPGSIFHLEAPAFLRTANAAADPATSYIGARLDDEAGISAYFKSPDAINLSQVQGQFRTVETQTSDYIIGSVPVPNHAENFDAHVYVHKTGWILAYYMRSDPIAKIIDIKAATINTTKLKTVVAAVASAAGALFTDVIYYDFRYPNATNMMLIAKDGGTGIFTIQLPSAYGYFDRCWAVLSRGGGAPIWVDGVRQTGVFWDGSMNYGCLTPSQLLPDVTHTITISGWDYAVLEILYRVQ